MSNPRASCLRTTRIRHNETLHVDGTRLAEDCVFCGTRGVSVSLSTCAGCSRGIKADVAPDGDGTVNCWTETLELDRSAYRGQDRVDFREAALRARTGQLLAHGVVSVSAETRIEALEEMLVARGARAASVVDQEGKLIGIVSDTDLLRWHESRREANGRSQVKVIATATVGDIMSPVVHALPESAPVAYAFGLFAGKDLREVPLVSEDGRLVGLLTSTDLLRWVARDLGYVL
jgi:CBS-domain-containing membrane protein